MTEQNRVTALLMVLDQQLLAASHMAKCAHEAAIAGEINLALGTLLPAGRPLEDALALFRVIVSLHRHHRDTAGAR